MKRRDFLRGLAVAVAAVSIGSSTAVAAPKPWADCSSFERQCETTCANKSCCLKTGISSKDMVEAVKSMKGLTA